MTAQVPTHVRLQFADGFDLVVPITQSIRLRNRHVNGVEMWPVEKIANRVFPDGESRSEFVHVEPTGHEHSCARLQVSFGTITAAEPVSPEPAPVEAPPPEPAPPVEPVVVAPEKAPRAKREKKSKVA